MSFTTFLIVPSQTYFFEGHAHQSLRICLNTVFQVTHKLFRSLYVVVPTPRLPFIAVVALKRLRHPQKNGPIHYQNLDHLIKRNSLVQQIKHSTFIRHHEADFV
uniref:Uncharacterized protein n=1 Tax=Lepeophtheirus salmonis TaxID=72036 RepID=A0A0K2TF01_LEPSM